MVGACSSGPSSPPSPTTSTSGPAHTSRPVAIPTDTPAPTHPTVTPLPYAAGPAWEPFGDPIVDEAGRTSASATAHGIRISITADATTISTTKGLWITTRLENRGADVLHWATDGCEINIGVEASTGVKWAYGAVQPPAFKVFKDWLLERYPGQDEYPISLPVTPDWAVDREGFGCADIGLGHDLAPGKHRTARMLIKASTGASTGTYGLAPAGPVRITGTFGLWWRGDEDMDTVQHDSLVTHLAVLLRDGRDPALISPGQAVDVALQAPVLQDYLRRYPKVPDFAPLDLTFDVAAGRWTIHAVFGSRSTAPKPLTIVVDARSATIVDIQNPFPTDPDICACPSP